MEKMTKCKVCGSDIAKSAKVCPVCGAKRKNSILRKWWFWVIIILLSFGLFAKDGNNNSSKKIGEVTNDRNTVQQEQDLSNVQHENDGPIMESHDDQADNNIVPIKTVYHVGDILEDGDMKIVYMASGDYISDNQFLKPSDGNKYIFLRFAFINTSNRNDASVSFYSFECYADGYNCEMFYGGDDDLSATLSAGRSTVGYVYFEIPTSAQEIEIEYDTNYFTKDKITFIFEGDLDSGYTLEANTDATEGAISVGEIAESNQMKISYLSFEIDTSYGQFSKPEDGYHYITCTFEFENTSTSDETISSFSFDCYADGVDCSQSFFREDSLNATLSPGRKAKGTVTFEVPDNANIVEFEYLTNFWTSNRVVFKAY